MSKSTPTATPSRRRGTLPIETPGSARSISSATDRSTLVVRVEELDLEVHDLKRQIAAERQRRRDSSLGASTSASAGASLSLQYIDPSRDAGRVKQVLAEKLKQMDDDALTALLTASSAALGRLFVDQEHAVEGDSAWLVMDAGMVPSKSVGIEGTGSGSDIDRRLSQNETGVAHQLSAARHANSVHSFLKDRQARLNPLLDALTKFSHLDIDQLDQTSSTQTQDAGGRRRTIRMSGNFARLFAIGISFHVVEDSSDSSPQIQQLQLDLPDWLKRTLDAPNRLYTKLLKRNDLPAILLMLRTMVPLCSLRRNLFTSLMESYTDLARDHVRSWERENGIEFTPYHPPATTTTSKPSSMRKFSARNIDENIAISLIRPSAAESFTLTNKSSASLTISFTIGWNRFGHAFPHITAKPHVPASKLDSTSRAFLTGFESEFTHLLRVAIAQNAIIGLPDKDEDEEDQIEPGVGRWGINAAIHATIRAFFKIQDDAASDRSDDDPEST